MVSSNGETQSIVIHPDDKSISVAQAIYHHVTSKTEKLTEEYDGAFTIDANDLQQLNHRITQTAQRHHQDEWSCEVNLALHKRERIRCSSFERFRLLDVGLADATSEVVYRYDFLSNNNIIPAGMDVKPERYRISVLISQINPMDELDEYPYYLQQLFSQKSIHVGVEYVDYTIARALLSAVREWVESLPKRESSKFSKMLSRSNDSIREMTPIIVTAISTIGCYGMFIGYGPDLNLMELAKKISYVVALLLCIYGFTNLATDGLMKAVFFTRPRTYILLTAGDRKRRDQKEKKREDSKIKSRFFIASIVLVVVMNVASSWIYDKIFK